MDYVQNLLCSKQRLYFFIRNITKCLFILMEICITRSFSFFRFLGKPTEISTFTFNFFQTPHSQSPKFNKGTECSLTDAKVCD